MCSIDESEVNGKPCSLQYICIFLRFWSLKSSQLSEHYIIKLKN